jgi:deoxycytidylate deaminase
MSDVRPSDDYEAFQGEGDHSLSHELDCELVIGLVAAVGTELDPVTTFLTEQLELGGYETKSIKISSDIIEKLYDPIPWETKYQRYASLMNAGNEARAAAIKAEIAKNVKTEDQRGNAVLAYATASTVFLDRGVDEKGRPLPNGKKAFIVRSLKRPEEVEALRLIYPQGFLLVGVHAEETRRKVFLTDTLGMSDSEAKDLIQRDANETSENYEAPHPNGQLVNKTFYLADFFVHSSGNHDRLRCDIRRMVELWFGYPFHTPTFDEYAMYMAFSSALRSADLSRQVGAVVTKGNQVLATGANDCPKAGGGLYWPERKDGEACVSDVPEGRDYKRTRGGRVGYDSNKIEQLEIIKDIERSLKACLANEYEQYLDFEKLAGKLGDGVSADEVKKTIADYVEKEFSECVDFAKLSDRIGKGRIRDLTEYGRVVHAEMEALLSCCRIGLSTVGTTLYCTTFPCHNCAKHIIAAGVDRVVYIEPYPKSKALEFHSESIVQGVDKEVCDSRVLFQPFVGIGPRRYFDLFSMNLGSSYDLERKNGDTGERREWSFAGTRLRVQMKPSSYLALEAKASDYFNSILRTNGEGK